jgi:type IX secretion system PorP/SprF family membrane protein
MTRPGYRINQQLRGIAIVLLGLFCSVNCFSQDAQFSQFYAAPLYLGPSMAGAGGNSRVCLNYRDQWPKLNGKFITYALSFDHYIPKYNSGVGAILFRDNAGAGKLVTTQIGLDYSYRLKLTKDFYLQPGLEFQYYERKIDFSKLTFSDQFYGADIVSNSIENAPDQQKGHLDFATSMLGFSKKLWAGFTISHLMKINSTLSNDLQYVPIKVSLYGGYKVLLKQHLLVREEQSLLFAFNYLNQASLQQLDLGMYYSRSPFMIGIWYRGIPVIQSSKSQDAITLSAGVMVDKLTFTYSYDLTISPLIASTGGAHELALIYTFAQKYSGNGRTKKRIGAVPCPKF